MARDCFNKAGPVRSGVVLTEWQSLLCQLLACPSWSLYLQSPLRGAQSMHRSLPEELEDVGEEQHPLGVSQMAKRRKECLEPQKSSECGHFLSFPTYSSASESMQKVEGGSGTSVCKQSLPKKRKNGGKALRKVKRQAQVRCSALHAHKAPSLLLCSLTVLSGGLHSAQAPQQQILRALCNRIIV